jgi:acetolactate decarboxylase
VTRRFELELSESVWAELQRRSRESGTSLSRLADDALSEAFQLERHSLFQVSTSNALAQGVFTGAVTVGELRRHGDFGLGTFAGLDGELIMIDGVCFRAGAGGDVEVVGDEREVPFALVTRFVADVDTVVEAVDGMSRLAGRLDQLRPSQNLFAGIRVDASFESLTLRAACPAHPGEGLLEATRHQSEYGVDSVGGTLVGFWAPDYARAVGVPGYHFHFISDDRQLGGHVLDLRGGPLDVGMQIESGLHLAIPETAAFLSADLSGDHGAEIEAAETRQGPDGYDPAARRPP